MKNAQSKLELVAALLDEENILSLATAGEDGEASVAPLFYIAGKDLSLYWLSSERSRHSLNLRKSRAAAVTIHRNTSRWKEICGVQMRGVVEKVIGPKRRSELIEAYCERFKLGRVVRLAVRQSGLYVFQPDFVRYIDNARGFGSKFELTRGLTGWIVTRR